MKIKFREFISKFSYKIFTTMIPGFEKLFFIDKDEKIKLNKGKIEIIDFCLNYDKSISSFADLGGIWRVEGGYTYYILSKHKISDAYLFDDFISPITFRKSLSYPQLTLYQLNFGSPEALSKLSKVDMILLFDVLLHQINPNWDEILEKWAPKTKYFVIYNQQFDAKKTVRLIDLGKEEYFKNVLHNPKQYYNYSLLFTDRDDEVRNSTHIWQWGIIDDDLRDVMRNLNFEEVYFKEYDRWGKSRFTNKGFVFKKMK